MVIKNYRIWNQICPSSDHGFSNSHWVILNMLLTFSVPHLKTKEMAIAGQWMVMHTKYLECILQLLLNSVNSYNIIIIRISRPSVIIKYSLTKFWFWLWSFFTLQKKVWTIMEFIFKDLDFWDGFWPQLLHRMINLPKIFFQDCYPVIMLSYRIKKTRKE